MNSGTSAGSNSEPKQDKQLLPTEAEFEWAIAYVDLLEGGLKDKEKLIKILKACKTHFTTGG